MSDFDAGQRWQASLAVALSAARGAARELRGLAGRAGSVREKTSHADLVTAVDLAAEQAARSVISAAFPQHAILGEEQGGADPDGREPLWYLDPLDGTTNFVHGIPVFGVSLAYAEQGRVRVGVIIDPNRDEVFHALEGGGAYCNGRRLQVDDRGDLRESLLATGFQYDAEQAARINLSHFANLMGVARNVRALGSAALALAYVAAGRLSGFWELRLSPWDVAAGALMVQEAGGRVTHTDGSSFHPARADIAASNGRIHDGLLQQLQRQRAGR